MMTSSLAALEPNKGGFAFINANRNQLLASNGFTTPRTVKTGTTIAGLIYSGGVVLGADTRATAGSIVADKKSDKIHRLAPRIYCCGAGTAADTEMTTRSIESQLELMRLNTGREVPIQVANRLLKQMLFRYQGHIGAHLIVGGVDKYGSHIYSIAQHGSSSKLPFATMGSGSLAAMSVLESGWKDELTEQEAVELIRKAIISGISNDLGSGSSVDINIIRKTDKETEVNRGYEHIGIKGVRQGDYSYKSGTTAVLTTKVIPIEVEEEEVRMEMEVE